MHSVPRCNARRDVDAPARAAVIFARREPTLEGWQGLDGADWLAACLLADSIRDVYLTSSWRAGDLELQRDRVRLFATLPRLAQLEPSIVARTLAAMINLADINTATVASLLDDRPGEPTLGQLRAAAAILVQPPYTVDEAVTTAGIDLDAIKTLSTGLGVAAIRAHRDLKVGAAANAAGGDWTAARLAQARGAARKSLPST